MRLRISVLDDVEELLWKSAYMTGTVWGSAMTVY